MQVVPRSVIAAAAKAKSKMTQPDPKSQEHLSNHDRLNGWKEIAGHVSKSVRTMQRWEQELGLPVHRIHTAGGEIVYSFRNEIDQWQIGSEEAGRDLSDEPEKEKNKTDATSYPAAAGKEKDRAAPTLTPLGGPMTQPQRVSSLPSPLDHERLSGWKEIASYIGSSVRTVQRWERELDLPVHRIHTARGEIIYAFRSTIGAWQAQAEQAGRDRSNQA